MPLQPGNSPSAMGFNIKELVDSGKKKGHIGNSKPKSGKALQKQATAIAYNKAGKSGKSAMQAGMM